MVAASPESWQKCLENKSEAFFWSIEYWLSIYGGIGKNYKEWGKLKGFFEQLPSLPFPLKASLILPSAVTTSATVISESDLFPAVPRRIYKDCGWYYSYFTISNEKRMGSHLRGNFDCFRNCTFNENITVFPRTRDFIIGPPSVLINARKCYPFRKRQSVVKPWALESN